MTTKQTPKSLVEARSALIRKAVFYSVILFQRTDLHWVYGEDDGNGGKTIPTWRGISCDTAFTDGRNIVVNMDFFDTLTLVERVFVLAHEAVHVMFLHPRRMKQYAVNGLHGYRFNPLLMNIAMDACINWALVKDGVGKMPEHGVLFPKGVMDIHGVTHQITGETVPEDVYKWLMIPPPPGGGGSGDEEGDGAGSSASGDGDDVTGGQGASQRGKNAGGKGDMSDGDVKQPDASTDSQVSEPEMKATVASALQAAKSQGTTPGSFLSQIDELLDPKIPWEDELRDEFVKRARPETSDWSKPNRRKLLAGLVLPRRVGFTCGTVIFGIDSSGSMSDREIAALFSEAVSIMRDIRPDKIYVIWCDAQVDRVDEPDEPEELLDLVRALGVPGRGGTKFSPVFDWVRENVTDEISVFIYGTDGYPSTWDGTEGVLAKPPIWLITTDVVPPHGRHIHLDVQ